MYSRLILLVVLSAVYSACGGGNRFSGTELIPASGSATLNEQVPADEDLPQDDVTQHDLINYEVARYRLNWGSGEKQLGDLYRPEDAPLPLPVIIMIHGGCWSGSYDLSLQAPLSEALASYGFAVWNIEYRALGTGGEWPGMFIDVGNAADYLQNIAQTENLDLNRVVAMGHSAGGHLALWLAGRKNLVVNSSLYVASPLPIKQVVTLGGIPDLQASVCGSAPQTIIDSTLLSESERAERLTQTSPLQMLPLNLSTLLISGEDDFIVPSSYSRVYSESALMLGDESQHHILEGADHFDLIDPDFLDLDWLVRQTLLDF